jgi:hypothetical protein
MLIVWEVLRQVASPVEKLPEGVMRSLSHYTGKSSTICFGNPIVA